MNENKQKIELSKEQFKTLLKVVYLGNWLANANRNGNPGDPYLEEYRTIENYIFSFAKQFGLGEYVDEEEAASGNFYPTRIFEEEPDIQKIIKEYDEETFWDELIDHLGDRDFFRHYSEDEIQKMSQNERLKKLYKFIDKWADEIDKYGIERLKIEKKLKMNYLV